MCWAINCQTLCLAVLPDQVWCILLHQGHWMPGEVFLVA
jgi:hypothetical protein